MKVAIFSPMILAMEKECGGAVEQLIFSFVEQNEKNKAAVEIDLYSVFSSENTLYDYTYTKFINIKISKFELFMQRVYNVYSRLFSKPRYDAILSKTIKEFEKRDSTYDAVIVENRMELYLKIYSCLNFKIPMYFHLHNVLGDLDKNKNNYLQIEKTCEKFFVVSDFLKFKLEKLKATNKIHAIYNCFNATNFTINERDILFQEELKKKFFINEKDKIIGFVGRLTDEKGIMELIKSFACILYKFPDVKLLVVGNSWFGSNGKTVFEKKLINMSASYKKNIIFTGFVNYTDIKNYYAIMNLLVVPSKCDETFGLSALEGMIMNLPIITTGRGGLAEVVPHECIQIDEQNFEHSLTNALDMYLSSKDNNLNLYTNSDFDKFTAENYYKNFINEITEE